MKHAKTSLSGENDREGSFHLGGGPVSLHRPVTVHGKIEEAGFIAVLFL